MKILFTMVLTIGLLLTSAMAQDPPKRLTDCQIAQPIRMPGGTIAKRELAQQNLSQPHRGLLDSLDINSQQWDRIKAERIKFGRVMKLASNDLGDSINVILRPDQLEALQERKEIMKQRVERWRGKQNGKALWVDKHEQRKDQHETSKPETKTESTQKD
tara:strand:+ start:451 stop:927 length:477 start_codon:yes stop_codon:yes gene_type:complete